MYLLVCKESRDHQVGNKIFSWGHWDMPLLSLLSQECQLKWSVIRGTETVLFVSVWLYEAFGFMFCWWQFSSWWCLYLILWGSHVMQKKCPCVIYFYFGDLCEFFITFYIAAVVHSQNSIGFPLFLQWAPLCFLKYCCAYPVDIRYWNSLFSGYQAL